MKNHLIGIIIVLVILVVGGFVYYKNQGPDQPQDPEKIVEGFTGSSDIRFISVGDSYTAGTGASPEEAWPVLLTNHLQEEGLEIELLANLSRNGYRTHLVTRELLPVFEASNPTFATLMIGINDWVSGVSTEDFTTNLKELIDRMQDHLPKKRNLVLIGIPDLSAVPLGEEFARDRDISAGIQEFNEIIKQEAEERKLPYVDVFEVSQEMKDNDELISEDQLHPSAKGYAMWEEVIFPVVQDLLK